MHTVASLKENPLNTCAEDSHKKHVDTNSGPSCIRNAKLPVLGSHATFQPKASLSPG